MNYTIHNILIRYTIYSMRHRQIDRQILTFIRKTDRDACTIAHYQNNNNNNNNKEQAIISKSLLTILLTSVLTRGQFIISHSFPLLLCISSCRLLVN